MKVLVTAGLLVGVLAGCGGDGVASSPEAAVEQFLAPFSEERSEPQGATASNEIQEFWGEACDGIDPRVQAALRSGVDGPTDPRVRCGAAVVALVAYTGDIGKMLPPGKLSGTPVSADTSGDTSVVTVDMRYTAGQGTGAPPPPAKATIRVLVVKRDGSWWIATPQAFNPLYAAAGGFDASELREQHAKLLAAR